MVSRLIGLLGKNVSPVPGPCVQVECLFGLLLSDDGRGSADQPISRNQLP
jgi:hypothetical protein